VRTSPYSSAHSLVSGPVTYLFGWNLDSNLLDGLGELIGLNGAVVVEVEVLEGLLEDGLLGLGALGFFSELVLELSFKAEWKKKNVKDFIMILT